jgi:DNA-binding NarL/FixJ family response regulator
MNQLIRVFLADSNPYFRIGLCHLLKQEQELTIIGETDSSIELLACASQFKPDVVLLDCRLPSTEDTTVLDSLQQQGLTDKVVAMSDVPGNPALRRLVQNGVPGCVLRTDSIEVITAAIRSVSLGHGWLSPAIAAYVPAWLQVDVPGSSRLNERELEVLALVAQGLTNQAIAPKLELSRRTVDFHVQNALAKLDASNRTVAVLEAIRRGWLQL